MTRLRVLTAAVSVAATAALALSSVPTAAAVAPAANPASSTLAWRACSEPSLADAGFECTRLRVPMDRDDPSGPTFSLALTRHRSTGTADQRIGSLVFNPGGPGGSGLESAAPIWQVLPERVRKRFDLVTWDPRGVGQTKPALTGCATPFPDRPATGRVDWAAVVRDFSRELGADNRRCQQRNSSFIEHLSTVENVADLDRIRAALGEEQLTYWGMSYGTRIGYVYALTYPDRVRAVVLDGPIDPASTLLSLSEGGAAPDQAYGVFADAYPQSAQQLREVLAALDQREVPLPGGVQLNRWDVLDPVFTYVASQAAYPAIADLIGMWHAAILGSGELQQGAAQAAAQTAVGTRATPNSNAGAVFSTVNCLDYADRPSVARSIRAVRLQDRLGPLYGGSLATMFARNCAGLTIEPDPVPVITNEGSPVAVLILGATRDGSTIVQWTARMSRAFPQSRTVTYAGGQHVTWAMAESTCVNAIANRYVITQELPAMDYACPNVVRPTD